MASKKELQLALKIAAEALRIADDWDLPSVQVYPPKEWHLDGGGEDVEDGWCSTYELSKKLRELSEA